MDTTLCRSTAAELCERQPFGLVSTELAASGEHGCSFCGCQWQHSLTGIQRMATPTYRLCKRRARVLRGLNSSGVKTITPAGTKAGGRDIEAEG
jgi:hypothetical protein